MVHSGAARVSEGGGAKPFVCEMSTKSFSEVLKSGLGDDNSSNSLPYRQKLTNCHSEAPPR